MKMKPEEITAIIKQQIQDYDVDLNVDDVGTVLDVGDGIAHIYGLERAMAGELLELPHGVYGLVLNLLMARVLSKLQNVVLSNIQHLVLRIVNP